MKTSFLELALRVYFLQLHFPNLVSSVRPAAGELLCQVSNRSSGLHLSASLHITTFDSASARLVIEEILIGSQHEWNRGLAR
jgi:hypothetical protein